MLYKFGTQYIQICMNDCLSILKQSRYFFYGQLSLDLDSLFFMYHVWYLATALCPWNNMYLFLCYFLSIIFKRIRGKCTQTPINLKFTPLHYDKLVVLLSIKFSIQTIFFKHEYKGNLMYNLYIGSHDFYNFKVYFRAWKS